MSLSIDDCATLRSALVDALVADGQVRSTVVEKAMRTVPRHAFIPGVHDLEAYENRAIPILAPSGESVSSLSAPDWVAVMLEELALSVGMRVLEVGGGTGYHAALVASIVGDEGKVVTVEIEPWLVERSLSYLTDLGFDRVSVIEGDGAALVSEQSPFDRIFLTTGTWEVFPAWFEQLAVGGHLVVPLQSGAVRSACMLVNLVRNRSNFEGRAVMGSEMVPMRGETGGARVAETTRAGKDWKPSSPADIRSVRVYGRSFEIEPGANEKLFVRGECQILLERLPG